MPAPASRVMYLDATTPLGIAHRGGAGFGPSVGLENSALAIRNAVDLGYEYIETDVRATADGEAYTFHDETLDRVTDGRGPIAELTAETVGRARIAGREPVPRLRDVLAEFATTHFNLDIKSDGAVEPALSAIEDADAVDRVCLAAFSHRRLTRIRRLAPNVATSASPLEAAALLVGRTPFGRGLGARGGAVAVQVPHRRGPLPVVTPRFVRRTHDLGLHVHVWTVDDPAEMRDLLAMGVDGLISDRIDTLRDVLSERGQWTSARPREP